MKIKFNIFYLLTILLIILGILTNGETIVAASWQTTIIKSYWTYFIPTSVMSIITALIYNYFHYKVRPVSKILVGIHFTLVLFGLLLSINLYRLIITFIYGGVSDINSFAFGQSSFIVFWLGPLLLFLSLVTFITGLIISKKGGHLKSH